MRTIEILLPVVAQKFPLAACLVDAVDEMEFRQAVEHGLGELDRGKSLPFEQASARIAEWAGRAGSC